MIAMTITRHQQLRHHVNGDSYTPTLTGTANVDGTPTTSGAFYQRIGSIVRVEATLSIDPTADATLTTVGISLPVTSDISAAGDLSGVAVRDGGNAADAVGSLAGDADNDRATLTFTSTGTAAETWHVSFTYAVA